MAKSRPVLVTTVHRGVFFGYATDTSGDTIKLELVMDLWLARNLAECRLSNDQTFTPLPDEERARITATVADAGANIEEVHHQRAFTMLAAQNVEIELVLQTRGKPHVDEVLGQLRAAGMQADLI